MAPDTRARIWRDSPAPSRPADRAVRRTCHERVVRAAGGGARSGDAPGGVDRLRGAGRAAQGAEVGHHTARLPAKIATPRDAAPMKDRERMRTSSLRSETRRLFVLGFMPSKAGASAAGTSSLDGRAHALTRAQVLR